MITLIEWAERHYTDVVIVLCDTLQRHNYLMTGWTEEQAHARAKKQGFDWIDTYVPFIQKSKVIIWDDILRREAYKKDHALLKEQFHKNIKFRQDIINDAQAFIKKKGKTKEQAIYSINYILEEITAHKTLYDWLGQYCYVYPGSFLESIEKSFCAHYDLGDFQILGNCSFLKPKIKKKLAKTAA